MDCEGRKMHQEQNGPFSTKLEILCFLFLNAWAILAQPFCVAVCERGARHKTGRKQEDPPGRKLVENCKSLTGRKLEFSFKKELQKTARQLGAGTKYIYREIKREREM